MLLIQKITKLIFVGSLFATVGLAPLLVGSGVVFAQTGGGVQEGLNNIKGEFPSQGDLPQSQTVGDVILAVIRILLAVLLAIAVLMIIIGGFQYVTSAGNEDRAKSGRKTLTYAIIGLVVVILSYVIVTTIATSLDTAASGL